MKGEYETALKLHQAHLSLAQELSDYAAQGRAYGNMGNAHHALGVYDQAVRFHRQELQISVEVSPGSASLPGSASCPEAKKDTAVTSLSLSLSGERPAVPGLHARQPGRGVPGAGRPRPGPAALPAPPGHRAGAPGRPERGQGARQAGRQALLWEGGGGFPKSRL